MILVPGFGSKTVPHRIRLTLACFLAILPMSEACIFDVSDFVFLAIGEFLVGLFLGGLARFYFESIAFLASIIATQSGLAQAQFFNASSHEQASILYSFLFLYVTLGVFEFDVSHSFIKAVYCSYQKLPIGSYDIYGDFAHLASFALNQSFLIAFKLASPFLVVNSLLLVASGIFARLAPSIQLFTILNPVQNLLTFGILLLVLDKILSRILMGLSEVISF